MFSNSMHPRIVELAKELLVFTPVQLDQPTRSDRDKLMAVRSKIKKLGDEDGVVLDEDGVKDRQFLYLESTLAANRQEDFYESNGNKWAV